MTERKRILLVEDEEIIVADLMRTLRNEGYEIAGTAASGREAIEAAAASNPDLVLMDVRLRGSMDGIEAARRIRQTSEVPIVFVTANISVLALDMVKFPGRYGSLAKPFSPGKLRETIEAILQQ
jgi:CheY-like chemotaxis protein